MRIRAFAFQSFVLTLLALKIGSNNAGGIMRNENGGGRLPRFLQNWRDAWWIREFRKQLVLSLAGFFVVVIILWLFLSFVQTRSGFQVNDPFLPLLPSTDAHWVLYTLYYSGLLLGLVSLILHPFTLLLALRSLVVLILLRLISLYLLPLEPPTGIIPLSDPILRWLSGLSSGQAPYSPITKDLFFCWHTSILSMMLFTVRWKDMKIIFGCLTLAASALILLQHSHYTIDVVSAPVFAYAACSLARWKTLQDVAGFPERKEKQLVMR
jgi:hypothetical protein